MKKHKSVVSILLAIMMVFTFMPTLAFADVPAGAPEGHNWDYSEEKYEVKATCTHYGVAVVKCAGEIYNREAYEETDGEQGFIKCDAEYKYLIPEGHTYGENGQQFTKAEILAEAAKENLSSTAMEALGAKLAGKCYGYVRVCKKCGEFEKAEDGSFVITNLQGHAAAVKPIACASSYTCPVCGETVAQTPDTTKHEEDTARTIVKTNICGTTASDGVAQVTIKYCKNCGEIMSTVYDKDYTADDAKAMNHKKLTKVTGIAAADAKYYCIIGEDPSAAGKFVGYAPTVVTKVATCAEEGEGDVICPDCGLKLNTTPVKIKKVAHTTINVSNPATCTSAAETYTICTVCGLVTDKTSTGAPTDHKYVVKKYSDANCYDGGLQVVECETCGDYRIVGASNTENGTGANKDKLYFTGFDGKLAGKYTVEVAPFTKTNHKWGAYENIEEATCLHAAMQARKCLVCGMYDVHGTLTENGDALEHVFVEKTYKPTCGDKGYTVKECENCGTWEGKPYDETAPVVKKGADCTFDKWVVTSKATPFKEGVKTLTCSVCGNDRSEEYGYGNNSLVARESVAKTKIAAPKVKALKKKAKVTVKAVEGAAKYQILVNGKVSKTVKKAGTFTVKKGIKAGKKNKFQIRAINADGVKATSKAKSVKIKK